MTTREKLVDKLRRIQQTACSIAGDLQNSELPNDLSEQPVPAAVGMTRDGLTDAEGLANLISDAESDAERLLRLTKEAWELQDQYRKETDAS